MDKKTLCLYFQVHQPVRLRKYHFFDIGKSHDYYDDFANRTITRKVAERCYLPANKMMLELIKKYGKNFKVSFSISGLAIEQFEKYAPEVIDSFKALAETGCVEFLAETYSHSLASLANEKEFNNQVKQHAELIKKLFGYTPVTFRNTELIYSDKIGEMVAHMGYTTMLTEGAKHILGWKSPNYVYTNSLNPKLKLLLKNFRLSDDIAFRFSDRSWGEWPLTAEKYTGWLTEAVQKEDVINLFMDYETFGEHQQEETGIFAFMRSLPEQVLSTAAFEFLTPREVVAKHQPVAPLNVPFPISWADEERDLTAWLGNELQMEAFEELYKMRDKVKVLDEPKINYDYKCLQASDHFYYMCTKLFSDGIVHQYFTPYDSPYEAFINYMNVLSDFIAQVDEKTENLSKPGKKGKEEPKKEVKKAKTGKKEVMAEVQTVQAEIREQKSLKAARTAENEKIETEVKSARTDKSAKGTRRTTKK
ncbi:glycoside hydrolase family 57 protein [uncultured Odoribacter sp.]|uniref:glycoside hydrolase family 57 protein n=1 Tax=uncultured Odoribacter sp. TaxID=876416 RepID=UPI0026260F1B|nr:glycoside hydrolase family 57 protein [uncultured Odoribacter sp.]